MAKNWPSLETEILAKLGQAGKWLPVAHMGVRTKHYSRLRTTLSKMVEEGQIAKYTKVYQNGAGKSYFASLAHASAEPNPFLPVRPKQVFPQPAPPPKPAPAPVIALPPRLTERAMVERGLGDDMLEVDVINLQLVAQRVAGRDETPLPIVKMAKRVDMECTVWLEQLRRRRAA